MLRLFRGRTLPPNPIGISPDCKVSVSQDGAVFLHTAKGIVYTSNGIGARIWQGLQNLQSVDEISARIGRDYDVPAGRVRQDAACFLAELESQGFLCRAMDR
jgi:Coenzyme PQQ synthesis protein D (PqqD)